MTNAYRSHGRSHLPKPGDRYLVAATTTTDWRTERDVTVTVEKVTEMTCGCTRLETARPGPVDGALAGSAMHLFVNRCTWHQKNSPDGTPEPTPVKEGS